ncbi:hypothetical protein [Brazilian marseillevirus]|uniref:hypothetical protein n=1 Tax=Brazilian marseillevirus TaxID=1813599 RepID=UPI0007861CE2|nr:hypothetical protein A3303_gp489 [Brazilian marseillevirus]AMQ10997.1 hypothetical protein [Brazilian marseillevirus]
MEQTILLKTTTGSFQLNKQSLSEKSSYFKSLFQGQWEGSQDNEFHLDIPFSKAKRIFDFAFFNGPSILEKDMEAFSYLFPGTSPHKVKERLPFSKETCEMLFPSASTFVFENGKKKCAEKKNFEFRGGYLVTQPEEHETSFETLVKNLQVEAEKNCYNYTGSEVQKYSIEGFWLWCYIVSQKWENFVQKMYEETGLVIVPAQPFFRMVFRQGNTNLLLSSTLLFRANREAFFVCDDSESDLHWMTEFVPYDNTKAKDEHWEHSRKARMLKDGIPLDRGFLMGYRFPEDSGCFKMKYFK